MLYYSKLLYMKQALLACIFILSTVCAFSQQYNTDSAITVLKKQKDSTLRAMMSADSAKIEKEFAEALRWEKLKGITQYPQFKGNEMAGVVPVANLTEIPDPNMEYKLLFELVANNPDSLFKEANFSLVEVSRIINLHIAAGIPVKKISPVIVIHAAALKAFTHNGYYQEKYKTDNPNLTLIKDLENIGGKFIACGQALSFINLERNALLPDIKISLTAQTVLSMYQMKGYVLYFIKP